MSTSDTYIIEMRATAAAREAGIADFTWKQFMTTMEPLKNHSASMYAHTLRVGIYAHGIAVLEGWTDRCLPLMGGCGHDLGKCLVPVRILDTELALSESDWDVLKRHPEDSYRMLKSEFPLTAMVAGLHHAFSPRSYGMDMSEAPAWFQTAHNDKVVQATIVVMICDAFDAMTTRRNNSTIVDPDDTGAVLEQISKAFSDWPGRTLWLSENRL